MSEESENFDGTGEKEQNGDGKKIEDVEKGKLLFEMSPKGFMENKSQFFFSIFIKIFFALIIIIFSILIPLLTIILLFNGYAIDIYLMIFLSLILLFYVVNQTRAAFSPDEYSTVSFYGNGLKFYTYSQIKECEKDSSTDKAKQLFIPYSEITRVRIVENPSDIFLRHPFRSLVFNRSSDSIFDSQRIVINHPHDPSYPIEELRIMLLGKLKHFRYDEETFASLVQEVGSKKFRRQRRKAIFMEAVEETITNLSSSTSNKESILFGSTQHLTTIHKKADLSSLIVSTDGKRVAYKVSRIQLREIDVLYHVVVDGKPMNEYDYIANSTLTFSEDGSRFGFIARKQENGNKRYVAVIDGREGSSFDYATNLRFSRDGKRFSYLVKQGERWHVVTDDNPSKSYDSMAIESPVFSPDGRHVSYRAFSGEKMLSVIDGHEGLPYDYVSEIIFDPTGKRSAYIASEEDKEFVVLDGIEQPCYNRISRDHLFFSATGKRFGYTAYTEDRKLLFVLDGIPGNPYGGVGRFGPVFSPDEEHCAYIGIDTEKEKNRSFVVLDGNEWEQRFDIIDPDIRFSHDSRQCAVVGADFNVKGSFIMNGQEPYPKLDAQIFRFSPKDDSIALVVVKERVIGIAINGIVLETGFSGFRSLAYSPDGNRLLFVGTDHEKLKVMVDGTEHPQWYDSLIAPKHDQKEKYEESDECARNNCPLFSPDSKHVVYIGRRGRRLCAVVDGIEVDPYDGMLPGSSIHFESDGTIRFLARKGRKVFEVNVPLDSVRKPDTKNHSAAHC